MHTNKTPIESVSDSASQLYSSCGRAGPAMKNQPAAPISRIKRARRMCRTMRGSRALSRLHYIFVTAWGPSSPNSSNTLTFAPTRRAAIRKSPACFPICRDDDPCQYDPINGKHVEVAPSDERHESGDHNPRHEK